MKIKDKDGRIDIQKIFITKDSYGGTNISIIINNQLIEIFTRKVYIDEILEEIKKYINVLGDDSYVRI